MPTATKNPVTMPTATKNPVITSKEDMLSEFVAEAPEKQVRKPGTRADFNADPDVLAKVMSSLTTVGAITGSKPYGSDKEARKAGKQFGLYAEIAVSGIEGKTVAHKVVEREGKFFWKHQIATKRERKEKVATETPATETPAATPAATK